MKIKGKISLATLASIIFSFVLIGSAISYKKANAQFNQVIVHFGGKISQQSQTEICCNGIQFDFESNQTNRAGNGKHLMTWSAIATSLKDAYALTPGAAVVGRGLKNAGVCITVDSECESTENVDVVYYSYPDQIGIAEQACTGTC